jgi:hypothetical protein
MAQNIAARRAAKAQRRKAIVAEKRKVETEANSTAGQARLASTAPFQHCLLSEGLFGTGMGILVLTRGATPYDVTMATFLLDTFALGVKDVYLRPLGGRELSEYIDQISFTTPMAPVEPAYARKLLHDLTAWAQSHGFSPHRDYAKVERIFGATDTTTCDAEFEFGQDGKPLLMGEISEGLLDSIQYADDDTIEGEVASETKQLEDASHAD